MSGSRLDAIGAESQATRWLPHGSREAPPVRRYSQVMRKFVATVSRYGGFESHVMRSHAA
jgi:hypothetical protein